MAISERDGKFYIGYTDDLKKRLNDHNKGKVPSTKNRTPLKLVYYEAYASRQDAMFRETNLKLRAKALRQLKNRIKRSLEAKAVWCGGEIKK